MFKFPVVQSNFLSSHNNPFTVESFYITSKKKILPTWGRGCPGEKETQQPETADNLHRAQHHGKQHMACSPAWRTLGQRRGRGLCRDRVILLRKYEDSAIAFHRVTKLFWETHTRLGGVGKLLYPCASLCLSHPHSFCHPHCPAYSQSDTKRHLIEQYERWNQSVAWGELFLQQDCK